MTMNDAPDTRGSSSTGLTLMGFALGAVVGAGLALLLAPASGRRTRQRLATTARRWSESAGHTLDQARDTVTELGTDAKSAVRAGQDAFLHDRATRESRSGRRSSHAGNSAAGHDAESQPSDEDSR
jgi:gas vesicle protein